MRGSGFSKVSGSLGSTVAVAKSSCISYSGYCITGTVFIFDNLLLFVFQATFVCVQWRLHFSQRPPSVLFLVHVTIGNLFLLKQFRLLWMRGRVCLTGLPQEEASCETGNLWYCGKTYQTRNIQFGKRHQLVGRCRRLLGWKNLAQFADLAEQSSLYCRIKSFQMCLSNNETECNHLSQILEDFCRTAGVIHLRSSLHSLKIVSDFTHVDHRNYPMYIVFL